MPVSKTDFVRGTQCEKMLWLDSHRPELKIIPPEVQARLDAGNAFGDGAMSIFGAYEETTCYKADGRLDFGAMIDRTKTLLADGCPIICEGAFSWYGNYCAADNYCYECLIDFPLSNKLNIFAGHCCGNFRLPTLELCAFLSGICRNRNLCAFDNLICLIYFAVNNVCYGVSMLDKVNCTNDNDDTAND